MKRFRLFAGSMLLTFALVSAAAAYSVMPHGYVRPKPMDFSVKFLDPSGRPLLSKQMVHVEVRDNGWGYSSRYTGKRGISKLTMGGEGPDSHLFVIQGIGYATLHVTRSPISPNAPPSVWDYSSLHTDENSISKLTMATKRSDDQLFVTQGIGYATSRITRNGIKTNAQPIVVKLQAGAYVTGKITDTSGRPLGGAMVLPKRQVDARDWWQIWNKQFGFSDGGVSASDDLAAVSMDGTGRYKIGPLPAGKYSLAACFPQKKMLVEKMVDVSVAGKGSSNVDIVLPVNTRAYTLRGKLAKEKDGALISNAAVDITLSTVQANAKKNSKEVFMPRKAKTDASGNFELYPVLPGSFRMRVLCDQHPAEKLVEVKDADTQVSVLLTEENQSNSSFCSAGGGYSVFY